MSFGDHLRSVADDFGIEPSRENLQQLGKDAICCGWAPFVHAVLAGAPAGTEGGIVVEGVRHKEAISTVRTQVAPLPVVLVFLTLSPHQRLGRLAEKGITADEGTQIDKHEIEIEVREVSEAADFRVDAGPPIAEVVASIVDRLKHYESPA